MNVAPSDNMAPPLACSFKFTCQFPLCSLQVEKKVFENVQLFKRETESGKGERGRWRSWLAGSWLLLGVRLLAANAARRSAAAAYGSCRVCMWQHHVCCCCMSAAAAQAAFVLPACLPHRSPPAQPTLILPACSPRSQARGRPAV